jgi:hypothetical protein
LDPLGAGEMNLQVILGSFGHWQGGLWLRSLKNSPVFAPFLATNPTLHNAMDQMTISGPLFIILWFHWELVK